MPSRFEIIAVGFCFSKFLLILFPDVLESPSCLALEWGIQTVINELVSKMILYSAHMGNELHSCQACNFKGF